MLFELFALWVIKDTTEQISKRLEEEQARKKRGSRRAVKKRPTK